MKILTGWKIGEKIRPGIILNEGIDDIDPPLGWRYEDFYPIFDEIKHWIPKFQIRQLEVGRDVCGMLLGWKGWDNNIEI